MTDIARHRAGRLRVMNAIYEAAEGSRMSHVSGGWLLEHLELSDEELGGSYDRTTHLEQRRRMIQAWANLLDELAAGKSRLLSTDMRHTGQPSRSDARELRNEAR